MLIIFNLIFIAFISAIIIFIREYHIKKKFHAKELENKDFLHKKELLETQVEIQTQTMKHIGREIHDNVGQKLTLSSIYLQQLLFENKISQMSETINNVNDIINDSLNELRQLSKSLTDDSIKNSSLSKLIDEECIKIQNLKTCKIRFDNQFQGGMESYQTKSILLRIVQEFFQNSIKHAQCKNIEILLSPTKNKLQLIMKDDGKGFDIKNINTNGIGLKNIKKRVEILNGKYNLQSNAKGTKLTIKIPV